MSDIVRLYQVEKRSIREIAAGLPGWNYHMVRNVLIAEGVGLRSRGGDNGGGIRHQQPPDDLLCRALALLGVAGTAAHFNVSEETVRRWRRRIPALEDTRPAPKPGHG